MNACQYAVNEYKKYRTLRNEAAASNDFHTRDAAEEELQYWATKLNQYNTEDVKDAMNN